MGRKYHDALSLAYFSQHGVRKAIYLPISRASDDPLQKHPLRLVSEYPKKPEPWSRCNACNRIRKVYRASSAVACVSGDVVLP